MAISTPTKLFEGFYTGALAPTNSFTLTSDAAVGSRVWLFWAAECGDTTPQTPTLNTSDNKGNTWSTWQSVLRNGVTGGTIAIYSSTTLVTSSLVSGDIVTITNPNADWASQRVCVAIASCTNVDGIDQTATTNPGSTASPSVGPVTTTTASQIIWAFFGSGIRAFTPGANFTEFSEISTSVGTSDRQLSVQYRIVSSTGSYSAPATLASATTVVGSMGTWKDSTPAATTPGAFIYDGSVWVPADMHFL